MKRLPYEWSEKYREMTPNTTNILQFNDSGFEYLFDFSSELIAEDIVPKDQAVEDRMIVVFGKSKPRNMKRDKRRISWSFFRSFGNNYDKGHFISHAIGGSFDANLFP